MTVTAHHVAHCHFPTQYRFLQFLPLGSEVVGFQTNLVVELHLPVIPENRPSQPLGTIDAGMLVLPDFHQI
jgi:hypothetical protein